MSAHRFALELAYGVLDDDVVAEHRCNEPLCVRVGDRHVICSTQTENMRYAVACGRARGAGDGNTVAVDRVARSIAVRAAVSGGWNAAAVAAAQHSGRTSPEGQLNFFA